MCRTDYTTVMGERTRAECVDLKLAENETINADGIMLKARFTPGRTDESMSYLLEDRVFTGDVLLYRATGRRIMAFLNAAAGSNRRRSFGFLQPEEPDNGSSESEARYREHPSIGAHTVTPLGLKERNRLALVTTVEYAPIGMAIMSLEGKFIQANHALCEIVGYPKAELEKLTFQEITYPDDLAADLAHVAQLLNGQLPSYQMEKRYIRKNGQIIWIQLTASILRDADSKPLYFISQMRIFQSEKTFRINFISWLITTN